MTDQKLREIMERFGIKVEVQSAGPNDDTVTHFTMNGNRLLSSPSTIAFEMLKNYIEQHPERFQPTNRLSS